ncbi:3857_t:CDS:2, partial [Scutellospora calospora]
MQTFLSAPKLDKKYVYSDPDNTYQHFVNAYVFYKIASTRTPDPRVSTITEPGNPIRNNAVAQKKSFEMIKKLETELSELEQIAAIMTNSQCYNNLNSQIAKIKKKITEEEEWLKKLKRHASSQQKSQIKKSRALNDDSVVVIYDSLSRLPLLFQHPNLHDQIHKENYNVYMSCTSMRNYILPHSNHSLAARTYYYPTFIGIISISRDDMRNYIDEHYCLASVKNAKQFAITFADFTVVLSQDDKVKIPVNILAVGKHFQAMQSINEPVSVSDHDFPIGVSQKLIPSHLSSTSALHMTDIVSLVSNENFFAIFKCNNEVKPLWVIIVDSGPNENPRHLKKNEICDYELELRNFQHAGQTLADLWRRDPIHENLYSLDIRKCNDLLCCIPKRASDTTAFLGENNGFLPLIIKIKDNHYLDAIYTLQYFNHLKIPTYDTHLPSLSSEDHSRRC